MKKAKPEPVDLVALALQNASVLEDGGKIDHFLTPENLQSVSDATLETLMLNRMNLAANIRKQISDSIELLATQIAEAKIAELLLQSRKRGKR